MILLCAKRAVPDNLLAGTFLGQLTRNLAPGGGRASGLHIAEWKMKRDEFEKCAARTRPE